VLEISVPLRSFLRGVERIDPTVPLPPAPSGAAGRAAPSATAAQLREQELAFKQLLGSLSSVARDLQTQYRQRLVELEKATVKLAVAIAGRLVHEKLEASDFAIEALVRKLVEPLETGEPVTVYLHPLDLALLEQRVQGQPSPLGQEHSVKVAAATALSRGSCRAEAGEWRVDAQLEVQLADIRDRLLRSLGQGD
jgi:flagellar assembly protein FliH